MDHNNPNFVNPEMFNNLFRNLESKRDVCLAEYVWIGGSGLDMRSKTKVISKKDAGDIKKLPIWNFDGSSTGQAPGHDSEVLLRPVKIYRDPFRGGDNILVLSECLSPDMKPVATNHRFTCEKVMEKAKDAHPWFGIEQEYTLFNSRARPLGWPVDPFAFPAAQGQYYCSVGSRNAFGRAVADSHIQACLYAGIRCSGLNGEVMPGQWEFQVGPCEGMEMSDDLWMARYILSRVAELYSVDVSFDPKPIGGDWNGAGCHTNYSTVKMREEGGMKEILAAIEKLKPKHAEHIAVYGEGNERRLTGEHETANIGTFSSGVADRGASIRIPRQAHIDGKGYLEDRRPASNIDPYVVTQKIVETTVLGI